MQQSVAYLSLAYPIFCFIYCCFGFRLSSPQLLEQYFNVSDPSFENLQGDGKNKFVINQASKELRVGAEGLDREQQAQYTLVVEIRSNGNNRGFAKVRRY